LKAAAANDLSAAKKLVELGYLKDAAERYQAVLGYAKDDTQKTEATKQLDMIAKRADEAFRNIRDLVRVNRLGEAGEACEEYLATFPNNMHGDEVAKILKRLRAGLPVRVPDAPPPPDPAKQPDDDAQLMLEKGMVQEWDRRYYEATETYIALTKAYPKSDAAAEANKRLKVFFDDKEMKRIIDEQKADKFCTRWLEMAALYEERGLIGDAASYYKRVIATFPDTAYATKAQEALDKLVPDAPPRK
jgi:TolA-binding protein